VQWEYQNEKRKDKKKYLRNEGITQALEHLLCKYEALNSNSSPTK
jgi:hypothetical protein